MMDSFRTVTPVPLGQGRKTRHGKQVVEWFVFDMVLNQCTGLLYIHAVVTSSLCQHICKNNVQEERLPWLTVVELSVCPSGEGVVEQFMSWHWEALEGV